MATAANFQHRANSLAYEAGEAVDDLQKQWDRLRDAYITVGSVLQRAKRLVDDPEFQRMTMTREVDTSELEPMLQQVGVICTRIGKALEE